METKALPADKIALGGGGLVLYSDFEFRKQKLVSSMHRLYKLRDAVEELFTALSVYTLATLPSCY